MQNNGIESKIRTFLAEHFPLTRGVRDDDDLLGKGGLDSLGILEVVTFVEQEFGLTVIDEELLPENFRSISSLETFVKRKLNDSV
jgi:acyl carrier protein